MPLSHQDVRNILNILDHAEHLESIDLRVGDFLLQARKPGAMRQEAESINWSSTSRPVEAPMTADPMEAPAATTPGVADTNQDIPAGLVPVRAPMIGTFFARPSPDQAPFVSVGTVVQPDDTVCLIEVMKMFNSVKAGVAGTVQRILVESGKPVRHGQALLLIAPTSNA
jgi:acetyl-CoA carboxylase biotin carboxyl carrier protein